MDVKIEGKPVFAHMQVDLKPGDTIVTESGAMASMASEIDLQAKLNGGFFRGLMRKYLGGESLFVNHFSNPTSEVKRLTLTQDTPGDVMEHQVDGNTLYFQPGAFIACDPGVQLKLSWAGFASWIAKEGLFRLAVSGKGRVWVGAFGAILERQVRSKLIVDTSHLVGYTPGLKLKVKMSGGLISSLTSGEGLVTEVSGQGKVWIQTRSLSGLAGWLNPRLLP